MTIRQTANTLGLKVRTIRQWIKLGKIKAVKNGKSWIIPEEEINRKEVQENANKGREHSRRIEESKSVGMLARGSEDTEESV